MGIFANSFKFLPTPRDEHGAGRFFPLFALTLHPLQVAKIAPTNHNGEPVRGGVGFQQKSYMEFIKSQTHTQREKA